jgi:hypothetical protein
MKYPIILIPSEVEQALSALPPSPPFNEAWPLAPTSEPQPLNVESISWGVIELVISLVVTTCIFGVASAGPASIIFLLGAGSIAFQVIKERKSYQQRHQKWQVQIRDYEHKKELYHKLQQQHELAVQATRTPETIAEYRQQRLKKTLSSTIPNDGNNSSAPRGDSEALFEPYLNKYFPGKIHTGLSLIIPNFDYPYSADFAYIDATINLYIDIEIDEPYDYKSGRPTHYSEAWKDEKRNKFFAARCWVIIRFAEEQVVKWPSSCCQVVASTISEITCERIPSCFTDVPELQLVNQWTKEEAEEMAANSYRNKYLNSSLSSFTTRKNLNQDFSSHQSSHNLELIPSNQERTKLPLALKAAARRAERITIRVESVPKNRQNQPKLTKPVPRKIESMILCPYCQVQVNFKNLEAHKQKRCPKRPG